MKGQKALLLIFILQLITANSKKLSFNLEKSKKGHYYLPLKFSTDYSKTFKFLVDFGTDETYYPHQKFCKNVKCSPKPKKSENVTLADLTFKIGEKKFKQFSLLGVNKDFNDKKFGHLGLGNALSRFLSYLVNNNHISSKVFSLDFKKKAKKINFGVDTPDSNYIKISDDNIEFPINSLKLGDKELLNKPLKAKLRPSSVNSKVPKEIYDEIVSTISKKITSKKKFKIIQSKNEFCISYNGKYKKKQLNKILPQLLLDFESTTSKLKPNKYFTKTSEKNAENTEFCLAITKSDDDTIVLGTRFLSKKEIVIDLDEQKLWIIKKESKKETKKEKDETNLKPKDKKRKASKKSKRARKEGKVIHKSKKIHHRRRLVVKHKKLSVTQSRNLSRDRFRVTRNAHGGRHKPFSTRVKKFKSRKLFSLKSDKLQQRLEQLRKQGNKLFSEKMLVVSLVIAAVAIIILLAYISNQKSIRLNHMKRTHNSNELGV